MAQTEDLLRLVNEFPQAFANPEAAPELIVGNLSTQDGSSITDAKTAQLLQLITKFPQAFADPEEPQVSEPEQPSTPLDTTSIPGVSVTAHDFAPRSIPAGYACALRRQVHTLTWGQVDFYLVYGDGLVEVWLTVGKSGTEVQSLGEATCRLINLLLSSGVSIPKIVREIRGIRGADSEGLGPNRILGLADLIGKVLQEAPIQYGAAQIADKFPLEHQNTGSITSNLPEAEILTSTPQPLVLEESAASTLCPECGAELQQVNGCKGGACIVCGHSSCS